MLFEVTLTRVEYSNEMREQRQSISDRDARKNRGGRRSTQAVEGAAAAAAAAAERPMLPLLLPASAAAAAARAAVLAPPQLPHPNAIAKRLRKETGWRQLSRERSKSHRNGIERHRKPANEGTEGHMLNAHVGKGWNAHWHSHG